MTDPTPELVDRFARALHAADSNGAGEESFRETEAYFTMLARAGLAVLPEPIGYARATLMPDVPYPRDATHWLSNAAAETKDWMREPGSIVVALVPVERC